MRSSKVKAHFIFGYPKPVLRGSLLTPDAALSFTPSVSELASRWSAALELNATRGEHDALRAHTELRDRAYVRAGPSRTTGYEAGSAGGTPRGTTPRRCLP